MNFLTYAAMAVTALIVGGLGFGLHKLDVNRLEASQRAALTQQASELHTECNMAQAITYGVSNAYQKDLTALSGDLAGLDGLHNAGTCVAVTGLASSRYDATPTGQKPVAGNERSSAPGTADARELISIAAKGEKYRLQLRACQSYVRQSTALLLRMPQKGH